jgi:hypothetical protein
MEGGLKGTEGSPPRAGWWPCRSPSKHFTLVGLACLLVCLDGACSDGRQSFFRVEGGGRARCLALLGTSRGVPFEVERRLE